MTVLRIPGTDPRARELVAAMVAEIRELYEPAGYVTVPDYNGNPYATYWGEKALAP